MDLRKAARAFRASLIGDLHSEYQQALATLQTEHDNKLAKLKQDYETKMADMVQEMEDPMAFMAKFLHGGGNDTQMAPSKKRGRSQGTILAIDGADDDEPAPPKRRRISVAAVTGQGTDEDSMRSVRLPRLAMGYDDSTSADEPVKKQTRGQRPVDLQFAAQIVIKLPNPHLDAIDHPFMRPVHAGNYPDYYRKIKHPMDLETMAVKLNMSQYRSAEEFKEDFELMMLNCNDYNPVGHPIRECGIRLRCHFEDWWNGKGRWERQAMREAERESQLADDEDREEDEEEGGGIDIEHLTPACDPKTDGHNIEHIKNQLKQIRDNVAGREARDKAKLAALTRKSQTGSAES